MMNLNELFIEYAKNNVTDRPKTHEEEHEFFDKLFADWRAVPSKALDGKTPDQYLSLVSPETLIKLLKTSKNLLVVEHISKNKLCAPFLTEIIEDNEEAELTGIAVELLFGMDAVEPLSNYINIIKAGADRDLNELLIERLKENIKDAQPLIYDQLDSVNFDIKTIFGEILVCGQRDERTFLLLTELFNNGKNIPLYAGYLGAYGDERAAAVLYSALDRANYADYIEIKNAIERLGGVVDEDMRDFTNDPMYKLIKG